MDILFGCFFTYIFYPLKYLNPIYLLKRSKINAKNGKRNLNYENIYKFHINNEHNILHHTVQGKTPSSAC